MLPLRCNMAMTRWAKSELGIKAAVLQRIQPLR
jgi:hypothetical protein